MIRRTFRLLALIAVPTLVSWSCLPSGSGGSAQNGDPAEAFTNALTFGGSATPVPGPMPDGSAGGPSVMANANVTMVVPGAPIEFQIPWTGGGIANVNIGFGGSKYFTIPAPQVAGQTQGTVTVSASVGGNVCSSLANTCHQIKCYEQVTLPNGTTVSKATAMQIVLNCTGGTDCNGNTGGSGNDAGTCGDPTTPINCGSFCCPAAKPVCGTGACCSANEVPCAQGCCPSGGACPPQASGDCATCCPGDSCCPSDLYCCGNCDVGC